MTMTSSEIEFSGPTASHRFLDVHDLTVHFPTDDGLVKAVDGVSFAVDQGKTLAIVGESGCGKSITSLTILGLLPRTARVSDSVRFRGRELLGLPDREMRHVRGRSIAMVFQDTMTSLNPNPPAPTPASP